MQRAEIGTAVRNYISELGVGLVTGTIVTNAINRSMRRINQDARINRGDLTKSLQTGVREYALGGTIMDVYQVRLGTGSSRIRLKPTSRAALDRDSGNWEAGTHGTPSQYYLDGMYLGVHPKPGGTATAYIRCLQNPANLSNATSAPSWLPVFFHDTIAKGAAVDLANGFLGDTEKSTNRLSMLYQEYIKEVMELRRLATNRSREYQARITPKGYETFGRD
jgi:hypothetical protein